MQRSEKHVTWSLKSCHTHADENATSQRHSEGTWDFTRNMAGTEGGTLSLSLKSNSFDAHFVFYFKRKFLWLFCLLGKCRKAWKTPEAINKLDMLSREHLQWTWNYPRRRGSSGKRKSHPCTMEFSVQAGSPHRHK